MKPLRLDAVCLLASVVLAAGDARAEIVINEIMYHSAGAPELEYVELVNAGPTAQDLTGWTLRDGFAGHTPCALAGTLEPGEFLVVANVLEWFADAYPGVTNVNPFPFGSPDPNVGFGLGNNSEEVRLYDDRGNRVDEVDYLDDPPWPPEPDGGGPSLELIHPLADNNDAASWRASLPRRPHGTPGFENSTRIADLPPQIEQVRRSPPLPTATDTVVVSARANDLEGSLAVMLWVDPGGGTFMASMMFDDGLHGDSAAGDGRFGATVPPLPPGTRVRYYVAATDDSQQTTTVPAAAPAAWYAYTVDHRPPDLRINEILASNLTGIVDGNGDSDDWLEIRNPGPRVRSLEGMFLTNDLADSTMWELPDVILQPGERLLIWCDGQPFEGPFHASFTLPRAGGAVGLFDTVDHGNTLIHGFSYGPQSADVAFGYRPEDADAPEYLATPTPVAANTASEYFSPVCINEFLASSQIGVDDWVELHNRSASSVDLGGWYLSDDPANPTRYALPPGTVLAPGGHLVLEQTTLGFGLSAGGDEALLLTRGDGSIGADWFDFGPQFPDISQGRFADGTPNWHFFSAWSAAAANLCQAVGEPAAVGGLVFRGPEEAIWTETGGGDAYDVVVGRLDLLRAGGGDFAAAELGCAENNSPDPTTWTPLLPAAGETHFYLVRATNRTCGFGTWEPLQAPFGRPRDAAIASAAPSCP